MKQTIFSIGPVQQFSILIGTDKVCVVINSILNSAGSCGHLFGERKVSIQTGNKTVKFQRFVLFWKSVPNIHETGSFSEAQTKSVKILIDLIFGI